MAVCIWKLRDSGECQWDTSVASGAYEKNFSFGIFFYESSPKSKTPELRSMTPPKQKIINLEPSRRGCLSHSMCNVIKFNVFITFVPMETLQL